MKTPHKSILSAAIVVMMAGGGLWPQLAEAGKGASYQSISNAIRSNKRCGQSSLLNSIVFAVEVHFTIIPPERIADF